MISAEQDAFLRSHRWCLLTTTRTSGTPQVSMVAYSFDGEDLVVSCRWSSAKFVNASRRPDVVVAVADDRRFLAVAGTAECIRTDPLRRELTLRLQSVLDGGDHEYLERCLRDGLDASERAVIRVRPAGVHGRV